MKSEDYFNAITDSILNISSKADLFICDSVIEKSDRDKLVEDCLILSCFYMSVYRGRPPFLLDFIENNNVKEKLTATERKQLGMFVTPRYIAECIVSQAIGPLVIKIKKHKRIKDKAKKICSLKICDPAVGGAIFLACAHNYLMDELLKLNQKKYSIEQLAKMSLKCLYGVDINPKAVEFSKLILNLSLAKWTLKKKIEEYANIAKKNSGSQKRKKGRSKQSGQLTAQDPARKKRSTKKTTLKKGKKKSV